MAAAGHGACLAGCMGRAAPGGPIKPAHLHFCSRRTKCPFPHRHANRCSGACTGRMPWRVPFLPVAEPRKCLIAVLAPDMSALSKASMISCRCCPTRHGCLLPAAGPRSLVLELGVLLSPLNSFRCHCAPPQAHLLSSCCCLLQVVSSPCALPDRLCCCPADADQAAAIPLHG